MIVPVMAISKLVLGSISAVSRVRSLILPEEMMMMMMMMMGDECGLIFPNSGW